MRRQARQSNRAEGFTLMEVLLVLGIIAVLGVLAVPFYQTFHLQALLDSTTGELQNALRTVQLSAMTGRGGSPHGVHFEPQQFVTFQGTTYTPGDPNNFITTFSPSVELTTSFGNDIVFSRLDGIPAATGTVTLSTTSLSHTLSINAHGTVDQTN